MPQLVYLGCFCGCRDVLFSGTQNTQTNRNANTHTVKHHTHNRLSHDSSIINVDAHHHRIVIKCPSLLHQVTCDIIGFSCTLGPSPTCSSLGVQLCNINMVRGVWVVFLVLSFFPRVFGMLITAKIVCKMGVPGDHCGS